MGTVTGDGKEGGGEILLEVKARILYIDNLRMF